MDRFHLLAVAALLGLGLAACSSGGSTTSSPPASRHSAPAAIAPSSPSQPSGTQVISYTAWSGPGALASGISAASTKSGSCFTTSAATTAPGAYRCMVVNTLYDPCFADATSSAGQVACPNMDNPDSVVVIKLTAQLPAPATSAGSSIFPWLVILANGQRCWTITGTGSELGGQNSTYICPGGIVYGQTDQSGPTWQVTYAPMGAAASAMTKVAVTKAYE